jgi:hypothetical protein
MRTGGRIAVVAMALVALVGAVLIAVALTRAKPSWTPGVALSNILSVRQGGDPRRVAVDVTLPAGLGPDSCARNFAARVTGYDSTSVSIAVTADLWSDPGCAQDNAGGSIAVDLPGPLGARMITVNRSTRGGYIATNPGSPYPLRSCPAFHCGRCCRHSATQPR